MTNVVRSTPGWLQYLYHILLTQLIMNPKQGTTLISLLISLLLLHSQA